MGAPILVHRVIARLNIGGPALHVVNLSEGLDRTGVFRTRLIAGRVTEDEGDMGYYARERGVEVKELPALSRLVNPVSDLRTLWSLYRLFRRERPDIVHTHTAKAGTLGRLAAFFARVPVRIHTFHGHVLGGGYFSSPLTRLYLGIERQLARISQRLVVLTESQKAEMAEGLRIAPPAAFAVIPLGLELDPFAEVVRPLARRRTREALGIGCDEVVVGIVGRLVPVKNHELLFRAHRILEGILGKKVRILVVGSGLRERELRKLAEELGTHDRISWLGWRQDLHEIYPAMDALALTSMDEGTPVAVLEALASGTPVAARAVGGVPEVLKGVVLARLIPGDTPEVVASALRDALSLEIEESASTEIRHQVRDRFATARMVSDISTLYRAELDAAGLAEAE
ncbi:MAG: glycosyltransferase [Longimicrobiales bacterium]